MADQSKFIIVPSDNVDSFPDLTDRFMIIPAGTDNPHAELYTGEQIIAWINQQLNINIRKGSVEIEDCSQDLLAFIARAGQAVSGSRQTGTTTPTTPDVPITPDGTGTLPQIPPGIPTPIDVLDDIDEPDPLVPPTEPDEPIPIISPIVIIDPPAPISVPVIYHPSQPQNMFLIELDTELLLNYEPPENDGGDDVTYEVAIKEADDPTRITELTWINNETRLAYLFTGLTNGTEYIGYARCRNEAGVGFTAEARGRPVDTSTATTLTLTITAEDTYYTTNNQGVFSLVTYLLRYSESVGTISQSEITVNNGALESVESSLNVHRVTVRPNSFTEPLTIVVGVDAASTTAGDKISAAVTSPVVGYSTYTVPIVDPPLNMQIVPKDQSLTVSWEAPPVTQNGNKGITGYQIGLDGNIWLDKPADVFTHTFTGLSNNQEVTVHLRSKSKDAYSTIITLSGTPMVDITVITIPEEELPGEPRNPAYFQQADGSLTVRWEAPLKTNFEGFQIRKGLGAWTDLDVNAREYTFSLDARWEIARVYLRSTNARGVSPTLELALTVIGTPDPIQNAMAEAGNGVVKVTWDALAKGNIPGEYDLYDSHVQHAVVRVRKDSDDSYPFGEEWGSHYDNEIYIQLENETAYVIEISSRTVHFQSDITREVTVTPSATHAATNAPGPVTGASATAGSGSLTINWTAPVDTGGGSGISHYELWIRPIDTNGEYLSWQNAAATATSYTFSNLNSGQLHRVVIRVVNNNGTFGQLLEHPPINNRLVSDEVEVTGTPT